MRHEDLPIKTLGTMPRLGRSRYLSCFYCSRKTSKVWDGKLREFDCPNCEATNYLDEVCVAHGAPLRD